MSAATNIEFTSFPIESGTVIRAWDFEKIEGRQECFVEGIVIEIREHSYLIHVIKDTVHPAGARLQIEAPKPGKIMFDFDNRIELVKPSELA